MRRRHKEPVDLRAEVENSREIEELLSWIETPKLVSVDFVVRCRPDAESDTRVEIYYQLSTPTMRLGVETGRESIRDALIDWACGDDEGDALISGLARRLGVDRDDVKAQVKAQLAERLPDSIEQLHDQALRMVSVNGETDFATALIARVLSGRPEVTDEAMQVLLDHRCVSTVMNS